LDLNEGPPSENELSGFCVQAHTLTVTPVDDAAIDGAVSSSVTLSLASADPTFDDWLVRTLPSGFHVLVTQEAATTSQ
jgi:hypothetical protein